MSRFDDFHRIEADILHTIPLRQAGRAMVTVVALLSYLDNEELEALVYCVNAFKFNTEPDGEPDDYAYELAYRLKMKLGETLWNDAAFWWSRLATELAPIAGMAEELFPS